MALVNNRYFTWKELGKKRAAEILELLHSLPFDYMNNSLSPNLESNPLLGIHPELLPHLNYINNNFHESMVKRGLDYYEKHRVVSLTKEENKINTWQAKVRGSQIYTVSINLYKNQTICTCPAYRNNYF